MGSSRKILILGGCALGLVRLLGDLGVDVVTEEEYRAESGKRVYVGLDQLCLQAHLEHAVVLPSLTAGMVLDYDPVVEIERRYHTFHRPELLRCNLENLRPPHVRGTWLGIEDFS